MSIVLRPHHLLCTQGYSGHGYSEAFVEHMNTRAKELGLLAVQRFFVIDSMAYSSIEKQLRSVKPDYIEILPALMPKVVSRICRISKVPVITGGLISDKEDVVSMLNAGAVCISSTNPDVWFL